MGRLPDFVIVGFPKCGTHSVLRNLGAHPDIHVHPDEGRFFGRRRIGLTEYMSLFDSEAAVVGEKSASYILSPESMEDLAATVPGARIVVCLRHPVHMLHSFYHFRVWEHEHGHPPGIDGSKHPFHEMMLADARIGSFGLHAADYATHLADNALTRFPRDRVHVVIQERLWERHEQELAALHDHLGVSPRPAPRTVVNSRVHGADRYPNVDYDHPGYPDALREVIDRLRPRSEALFDLLGNEIPEWRRYDEMYEAWASG